MRPFHHREPGILSTVLTDDRVFAEVICDGHHVHAGALEMLLRAKGTDRTLLASDSISAADMPDGNYSLGNNKLAGSTLTLDRAVRNLVAWLGMPLQEALIPATLAPARSMGWNTKGIIEPGADADLVFLDVDLNVVGTMIAGRLLEVS
jgi:N-acetylglucosamine-6-phosphate deacetylase